MLFLVILNGTLVDFNCSADLDVLLAAAWLLPSFDGAMSLILGYNHHWISYPSTRAEHYIRDVDEKAGTK